MVRAFRQGDGAATGDADTPLILMGYYNPIYIHGVERFLAEAREAGVDGLIVVDLPPEEDAELCLPARAAGIDFIRLATPTTDAARLPAVLANTSGFLYYVSIAGITGTAAPSRDAVAAAVARLKAATDAAGGGRLRREDRAEPRPRSPAPAPMPSWSVRPSSMHYAARSMARAGRRSVRSRR